MLVMKAIRIVDARCFKHNVDVYVNMYAFVVTMDTIDLPFDNITPMIIIYFNYTTTKRCVDWNVNKLHSFKRLSTPCYDHL